MRFQVVRYICLEHSSCPTDQIETGQACPLLSDTLQAFGRHHGFGGLGGVTLFDALFDLRNG